MIQSRSLAFGAIYVAVILTFLSRVATPVAARDRPGTPNRVEAHECYENLTFVNLESPDKYAKTPRICVRFDNTATEKVVFAVDWMMNGETQSEQLSRHRVVCWEKSGIVHDCSAAKTIGKWGNVFTTQRGKWHPQGLAITSGLTFDTDYCFRFEAIDEDGVISEIWSEWACVHTRSAPPRPPAPTGVQVTLLSAEPGAGVTGPDRPPRVLVEWSGDDKIVVWHVVDRFNNGWPKREPEPWPPGKLNKEHEAIVEITAQDFATNPTALRFRVCAGNVSGEACSPAAWPPSWRDSMQKPNRAATEMMPSDARKFDARPPGAGALLPRSGGSEAKRPLGGLTAVVAAPTTQANAGSFTDRASALSVNCKSGFVWRVARPEDLVCVTPAARSRTARENAEAANHVDPAGAYGANTCASGYVWRNAFEGDAVCVTAEARALASEENRLDPTRRAN